MENKKTVHILLLVLGVIGLSITSFFIYRSFNNSKDINSLIMPLAFSFLPFIVSFAFISIGIKGAMKKI